ncbi:uncharacterized protein EAE97_007427 [Botrytis byssoidea]|uniref:Uncharacterized protein n=1 Tax=Botrytis byssoidea TaxID=139641 RepID=A0A9P5INQ2_9HELO|nr:uncharacterized protein EAE97_007427 [Botrytis byssoidea]KAF7939347.1 hypothetical protein EAE97_007427 [Botrytis byssoidea]
MLYVVHRQEVPRLELGCTNVHDIITPSHYHILLPLSTGSLSEFDPHINFLATWYESSLRYQQYQDSGISDH